MLLCASFADFKSVYWFISEIAYDLRNYHTNLATRRSSKTAQIRRTRKHS